MDEAKLPSCKTIWARSWRLTWGHWTTPWDWSHFYDRW